MKQYQLKKEFFTKNSNNLSVLLTLFLIITGTLIDTGDAMANHLEKSKVIFSYFRQRSYGFS